MQENLVIVESPAKAKTIEKFLGKDFVVKSSFGHIRDLSKKDLGVNLDKDYEPVYEIPSNFRRWPRRPRPSGSRPMKTAKERRSPGTSQRFSACRSTKPSESFSTKLPNRQFWQPSNRPARSI